MIYQPSIFPLGLRIDEPVTVLTDLIVSAVCFYAWYKLGKLVKQNEVNRFLRLYFLTMGLATLLGGIIGHGFLYALDSLFEYSYVVSPWKLPGWVVSMFSITLVERASIEYTRPIVNSKTGKILAWINIIELVIFLFIVFFSLNFWFVQVHAAYGLLLVVSSLNIYVYYKRKTLSSKIFLLAVGFAAIGALVYMNQWSIDEWFNYFDISHLFMAASAYTFYKGARQLMNDPLL
jgi:hypothetical protein